MSYAATEATRLAGVTYRQLDYWARTGLVCPSLRQARGSGSQRRYDDTDVACLRAVGRVNQMFGAAAYPLCPLIVEAIRAGDEEPITLPGITVYPVVLGAPEPEAAAA